MEELLKSNERTLFVKIPLLKRAPFYKKTPIVRGTLVVTKHQVVWVLTQRFKVLFGVKKNNSIKNSEPFKYNCFEELLKVMHLSIHPF